MDVWLDFAASGAGASERDDWLLALLRRYDLPATVRHVGAALAARVAMDGVAPRDVSPSLEQLAEDADVGVRVAAAAIKDLEDEGWLLVDRTRGHRHAYQLMPRVLRPARQVELF